MITTQQLAQQYVYQRGSSNLDDSLLPSLVQTWLTGLILEAWGEPQRVQELQAARNHSDEIAAAIRALQRPPPGPRQEILAARGLPGLPTEPPLPTPEQVAAMSLEEYAKARKRLGVPELNQGY